MRIIVYGSIRLLRRVASRIERSIAGWVEVVDVGEGAHDEREEHRIVLRFTRILQNGDGRAGLGLLAPIARSRFVALKAAIQARRDAGTATPEEAEIDALPGETDEDSSWDTA